MDTEEDRLAIMRWEDDTGPTSGKNRRYGTHKADLVAATRTQATGKGIIKQGRLRGIPIVNRPASRAVANGAGPQLPAPGRPHAPRYDNESPRRPKLPRKPS